MSHTAIRLTPAEKFMKEGGGAIRVRICTPDISGGVPGEKCRSRHVQVCYGIPRRQILHCADRYVSLYMSVDYFEDQRREMVTAIRAIADHVAAQISKSALDKRVLEAMAKVPRHEFVPVEVQQYAYLNRPLPIGFDKTISQPLMVAVMTDLLELKPDDVVLEIGTGLGYQSAVLAELAGGLRSRSPGTL
jgi:Protein-L-isoaspartate(D-aspartate) O-methyltransferase (PCMT)